MMQAPVTDWQGGFSKIGNRIQQLGQIGDSALSEKKKKDKANESARIQGGGGGGGITQEAKDAQKYLLLKKKLGNFDKTKQEYAIEAISLLPKSSTPQSKKTLAKSIQSIAEPEEFVEKVRAFELQRQYHGKNTKGLQPQFGMSVENWLKLREEGRQEQGAEQQQALGQASRDVAGGLGPASPVLDPTTGE